VDPEIIQQLHAARRGEKEQALFYRELAAQAEEQENAQLSEDLNGLHADEQHHLSRLTVRLIELDEELEDLNSVRAPLGSIADLREREQAEVERYTHMLTLDLDAATRDLIEEILTAETQHAQTHSGKHMNA
jgi:rubrerythrin